jgi:integrase/DNA-binding transcriptional regulator YhcF (GntR family)
MAGRPGSGKSRARGNIETLRSGALRVRVYAGIDPVTKKRHNLIEVVEPGPKALRKAEEIRDRFLREIAEKRNPRTSATIDQLLTRYLDQLDGSARTLELYRGYVRKHISPLLGRVKVGELHPDVLDSFYSELRRCRHHCDGRRFVQHRTTVAHECDDRCGQHRCQPLGPTTVRHMHFILSGAYRKAVRWRWVSVSPIAQAEPPPAPPQNPQPPSPADAARIVNEAWRDPDWGTLVWVAMTTGARRGELAALRWSDLDLTKGRETAWLRRAIRKADGALTEGEMKTHQQRRVALDADTATALREHLARWAARLEAMGLELGPSAYVFSGSPEGQAFPVPDGITQRYDRLARRLGIKTTFHKLRHYSATELIAGGVDVRTVAGRLGHSGGGSTTLRTYTAWVSEADQRAATGLGSGMPSRPARLGVVERQQSDPRHPYERVAAELRRRVLAGEIAHGDSLPTEKQLVAEHEVSVSTIRRATALLRSWGVVGPTGRRVVAPPAAAVTAHRDELAPDDLPDSQYWSVTLRGPNGYRFAPRLVRGNLAEPDSFRPHLVGIAKIEAPGTKELWDDYELEIRVPGTAPESPASATLRWSC